VTSRSRARFDPNAPNDPAVEAAFEAAPPEQVAEILDGELVVMPRPKPRHARASGRLLSELDGPFDRGRGGPGGWVVLVEPELRLGAKPDKLVPDLAGWRREGFPAEILAGDAESEPAAISVTPNWVCEILSESTEATDRGKMMRIYRREKVPYVWLLDPRSQTLEVYRLNERGHWEELETYEGAIEVRAEPFDAVAIDLSSLWSW
jgi:Uma2 family endonuclease